MKDFKPSPFDFRPPGFGPLAAALFSGGAELTLWATYFLIFSETINLGGAYITALPFGSLFEGIAPDANVSDLVCVLLATFSIIVPLFIWSEILDKKIFLNPREFFSYPQHRILAGIALSLLVAAIAIECIALFSLLQKAGTPAPGFVVQGQIEGMIGWLSENRSYSFAISFGLALINLTLSFFAASSFKKLTASQE